MDRPRRATNVGYCLDVDGTLHRTGSVFVEMLARLGYDDAMHLDSAERRHRRNVIGTVVEYGAGETARRRWGRLLWALDALAVLGAGGLAGAAVTAVERLRRLAPQGVDREPRGTSAHLADGDGGLDYRRMQRRALDAYGEMIAGRRRRTVERAASEIVGSHVGIDPAVSRAVERVQAAGADVCLITDAPAHAARAYARELTGSEWGVAATRYHVDEDGRYTGEYTMVDKGAASRRLRSEAEWERLIAGGDAAVDLPMAEPADLFLAVEGEGRLLSALDAPAGPSPPADCAVVRVDRDRHLGPALVDALDRVTDRAGG